MKTSCNEKNKLFCLSSLSLVVLPALLLCALIVALENGSVDRVDLDVPKGFILSTLLMILIS